MRANYLIICIGQKVKKSSVSGLLALKSFPNLAVASGANPSRFALLCFVALGYCISVFFPEKPAI